MVPPVPEEIRPLKRVEYEKLVDLGAFEDEKIELLEGVLVPMSPVGFPHCFSVQALTELLVLALAGRATIRPQLPFAASDLSEPEPDFIVAPRSDYLTGHPDEAHLIIEVSESSLAKDRGVKLRIYALRGVPEYWIVNLVDRRVEVHRDPEASGFRTTLTYEPGDSIRLVRFPDVALRVSDFVK